MRKLLATSLYIIQAVILLLLTACNGAGSTENAEDQRLSVYTSIYPMYDFAKKTGGDRVKVQNLVPAGTEPHDWEPTPRDIAQLEKADILIYNGAGMEGWIDKILASISSKKLLVVEASKGIDLLKNEADTGKKNLAYDPHVWLDPIKAEKEMENIKDALVKADPDNSSYYEDNYTKYAKEFGKLNEEYKTGLKNLKKDYIVVAHQAYGYLCNAYGLKQVAIEGLAAESEPTPARMAEIATFAKKNDVRIIFFEELISPKVAKAVADEVGAKTMVLNPLEGLKDEEINAGKDYFTVMRSNLKALQEALK